MTKRLGAFGLLLAALAFSVLGCSSNEASRGTTTPQLTASVASPQATPLSFAEARDALANRLATIGANVGFVPPDVKQDLLVKCGQLANQADHTIVAQLCNAINVSIQGSDPGLMDNVIRQLRALKPK